LLDRFQNRNRFGFTLVSARGNCRGSGGNCRGSSSSIFRARRAAPQRTATDARRRTPCDGRTRAPLIGAGRTANGRPATDSGRRTRSRDKQPASARKQPASARKRPQASGPARRPFTQHPSPRVRAQTALNNPPRDSTDSQATLTCPPSVESHWRRSTRSVPGAAKQKPRR